MADYKVLITRLGLDKLENALAHGEKLVLTHMGFSNGGDEKGNTEFRPSASQVALTGEVFRAPLREKLVLNGQVYYKSCLLSTDPAGNFTELGLFTEDNTLYAVANIPKIEHKQATSGAVTETEVSMVMVAENADIISIQVSSDMFITREYGNLNYLRLDGESFPTSDISFNMNKITDVAPGKLPSDVATVSQLKDIGEITLWAGVTTPSDCLDCDGSSYSRQGETQALYQKIGTIYGTGEGNLSFQVPNIPGPLPEFSDLRYIIKYKY